MPKVDKTASQCLYNKLQTLLLCVQELACFDHGVDMQAVPVFRHRHICIDWSVAVLKHLTTQAAPTEPFGFPQ